MLYGYILIILKKDFFWLFKNTSLISESICVCLYNSSCLLTIHKRILKKTNFSFSTQTHVLELIQELGLETYPQYTTGKKVYHMGGPGSKIHTYSTSIPSLSPMVLMDFTQFLWRVRQQTFSRISFTQTFVHVELIRISQEKHECQ